MENIASFEKPSFEKPKDFCSVFQNGLACLGQIGKVSLSEFPEIHAKSIELIEMYSCSRRRGPLEKGTDPCSKLVRHLYVYLVCSAYQVEVVFVQELGGNLCAEREGDAAIVFAPAHCVLKQKQTIL